MSTTVLAEPQSKHLSSYREKLEKFAQSPILPGAENAGRGNIVLASSEGTAVSREKIGCIHLGKDGHQEPHTHGAFSFHLIEGLDGKAADSKTGIITIDDLRRYVEAEMKHEGKQRPMYHITEGADLESIIVAKSLAKFNATISETVKDAEKLFELRFQNSERISDIQCLANAAKKVYELTLLDPKNQEIDRLSILIDGAARELFDPALRWITANQGTARLTINQTVQPGLYPGRLRDLVQNLSVGSLQRIDQNTLNILIYLFDEVIANNIYKSEKDDRLISFRDSLRAALVEAK
jgi:hypothetical protein